MKSFIALFHTFHAEIHLMCRTRPRLSTLVLLFAALFLCTACSEQGENASECRDPLGCVQIDPGEPLHIGVLQALSGDIAPLGLAQIRGLELALAKRGNTLLEHSVVLQIEDTGCTSEGGANAALKVLADPQTVAIYGTTCSAAAATASQTMSAAGLTMISGNNSAPFLTSIGGTAAPDWQPGYFRTSNNEENAGRIAAEYAHKVLGIRKAATIHDNDIYTMGLASIFRTSFEELGGQVTLFAAVNKGDLEMQPVLEAVSHSQAELLFFPLFQPEGKQVLLQARKMPALKNTLLMSDGALIQQSFLDAVGAAAIGMYFVGPALPVGPAAESLNADYIIKYKEPPAVSYYIIGYDAANLLFKGIVEAAVTAADGTLYIGRQRLRDALYATTSFPGITGTLSCDKFGDCGQPAFNILRLDTLEQGLKGLESSIVYSSRQPR